MSIEIPRMIMTTFINVSENLGKIQKKPCIPLNLLSINGSGYSSLSRNQRYYLLSRCCRNIRLLRNISSRAFLDEIAGVIITSSSDDEAGLSDRQSADESEDIQHPASCADWDLLTFREREKKLHEYRNGLSQQRPN